MRARHRSGTRWNLAEARPTARCGRPEHPKARGERTQLRRRARTRPAAVLRQAHTEHDRVPSAKACRYTCHSSRTSFPRAARPPGAWTPRRRRALARRRSRTRRRRSRWTWKHRQMEQLASLCHTLPGRLARRRRAARLEVSWARTKCRRGRPIVQAGASRVTNELATRQATSGARRAVARSQVWTRRAVSRASPRQMKVSLAWRAPRVSLGAGGGKARARNIFRRWWDQRLRPLRVVEPPTTGQCLICKELGY